MSGSFLDVAFAHHAWATARVIEACLGLSDAALETDVSGTRGPMLETLRHLVLSDAFDLFILTGDRTFEVDREDLSPAEALVVMERNGPRWAAYLARPLDPDEIVREVDESDGFQRWAPIAFRLAGVLNHGSDHRSQICTALTTLGVEPPRIDVVDFGLAVGRITEQMPGG